MKIEVSGTRTDDHAMVADIIPEILSLIEYLTEIDDDFLIQCEIVDYHSIDCYGMCEQISESHYKIWVCDNQCTRDFVATIVHELVHVVQWVTGKWKGHGEKEANNLQYLITDRLWRESYI